MGVNCISNFKYGAKRSRRLCSALADQHLQDLCICMVQPDELYKFRPIRMWPLRACKVYLWDNLGY